MLREKCQGCLGRTLIPVAGRRAWAGNPSFRDIIPVSSVKD